jgi:hypothetical protein
VILFTLCSMLLLQERRNRSLLFCFIIRMIVP